VTGEGRCVGEEGRATRSRFAEAQRDVLVAQRGREVRRRDLRGRAKRAKRGKVRRRGGRSRATTRRRRTHLVRRPSCITDCSISSNVLPSRATAKERPPPCAADLPDRLRGQRETPPRARRAGPIFCSLTAYLTAADGLVPLGNAELGRREECGSRKAPGSSPTTSGARADPQEGRAVCESPCESREGRARGLSSTAAAALERCDDAQRDRSRERRPFRLLPALHALAPLSTLRTSSTLSRADRQARAERRRAAARPSSSP